MFTREDVVRARAQVHVVDEALGRFYMTTGGVCGDEQLEHELFLLEPALERCIVEIGRIREKKYNGG